MKQCTQQTSKANERYDSKIRARANELQARMGINIQPYWRNGGMSDTHVIVPIADLEYQHNRFQELFNELSNEYERKRFGLD